MTGLDTPLMRESIPPLCVEIHQIPREMAVDDFRLFFVYAESLCSRDQKARSAVWSSARAVERTPIWVGFDLLQQVSPVWSLTSLTPVM